MRRSISPGATPTHCFAVRGPRSRSSTSSVSVKNGNVLIQAACAFLRHDGSGDVHPARGWARHRRQGRALGPSVDQAWCAAPATRMGPPLTESPGRCRVDERGSCEEPHGGHHAARCAGRACSRAGGNGARHWVPSRGSAAPVRFQCAQPPSRGCGWQGPGRSLRRDVSGRERPPSVRRTMPAASPVQDGGIG